MTPRRARFLTPVGLALLCAPCAAGALLAALAAFGFASLPAVAGVGLEWALPPAFILGGFALWLWSGRRASAGVATPAACRKP